jgi:hypothetical protein
MIVAFWALRWSCIVVVLPHRGLRGDVGFRMFAITVAVSSSHWLTHTASERLLIGAMFTTFVEIDLLLTHD